MNSSPAKTFRRKWIVIAFGVAAAIIILVAVSILDGKLYTAQEERMNSEAVITVEAFEQHTAQLFDHIDLVLQSVRMFYQTSKSTPETGRYLSQLKSDSSVVKRIAIFDKHGAVVLTERSESTLHNVSGESYFRFQASSQTDELFISSVETGVSSGKPRFWMSRKITNPDGSFNGIVAATIDPESFTRYFYQLHAGPQIVLSLLGTHDKKLRARIPQPEPGLWNEQIISSSLDSALIHGEGTLVFRSPVDQIIRNYAFKRVGDRPFVVLVGYSDADVRALVMEWWMWIMIGGLVFIAGIVLITFMLLRLTATKENLEKEITEHRRSDTALAESQANYRRIVETAIEGILSVDDRRCLSFVNQQLASMLGYTIPEMLGRPYESFLPEDQREDDERQKKIRAQGKDSIYERCFLRKDGSRSWMVVSAKAILDENGKQIGSFGMFTDINERKRIESALRESEERYRRIVETAIEGILTLDSDIRITFVNHQMASMLGYTIEEMRGRLFEEFLEPDQIEDHRAKMVERRQGKDEVYERSFRTKSGNPFWILVSAKALMNPDFTFAGSFAMFTNINDRKLTEAALKESESNYRRIVETAIEGILSVDSDRRVSFVNNQLAAMLGYTPAEMIGRKYESFLPEDQIEEDEIQKKIRASGRDSVYERCFQKKDGTRHWALVSAKAVRDSEGNTIGSFGMFTDIDHRKKIEHDRERLIFEIQQALDQIKTLRGIVPICASCKKVRDDKGYWEQVEAYVSKNSEAQFSHSICPDCAEKYYGEYIKKKP